MDLAAQTACRSARAYQPREAERSVVHRIVARELDDFVADAAARGHPLPRFVESTMRDFLTCGLFEHGFVTLQCTDCGTRRTVAFSCKRRGVCSSCQGRRMSETAAHLADRVLPAVPIRQWVLSLPFPLRYRLAYDRELMTPILGAWVRALSASLRRRARAAFGVATAKCGAVTFVQRFGGALNLNVHFHTLALDGVYEVLPGAVGIRFRTLPPPDTAEVLRVLSDTAARMLRALTKRGLGEDSSDEDPLAKRNPVLAAIYAAALQGRAALGEDAGQPLVRIGREDRAPAGGRQETKLHCAVLGGFSLHAGVSVSGRDRAGLERLCRYMGRPALAAQRLEELPDGRLMYRLRHRWRDGTSALVLKPGELLARLAAQVPPPGAHQVRYHGTLAPGAMWRSYVVPPEPGVPTTDRRCKSQRKSRVPQRRRIAWSELLRRVFAIDALVCPACSGRMEMRGVVPRGRRRSRTLRRTRRS